MHENRDGEKTGACRGLFPLHPVPHDKEPRYNHVGEQPGAQEDRDCEDLIVHHGIHLTRERLPRPPRSRPRCGSNHPSTR